MKVAFVDTKHGLPVCVARRGVSRDVAHAPASGEKKGSESLQVSAARDSRVPARWPPGGRQPPSSCGQYPGRGPVAVLTAFLLILAVAGPPAGHGSQCQPE